MRIWNLNQEDIYKIILDRGEGKISKDGALVVKTGIHTGRSAQDKFVVRESKNKDSVWWDNAKEMSEENFNHLYRDMIEFSENKDLFIQDLLAGQTLSTDYQQECTQNMPGIHFLFKTF